MLFVFYLRIYFLTAAGDLIFINQIICRWQMLTIQKNKSLGYYFASKPFIFLNKVRGIEYFEMFNNYFVHGLSMQGNCWNLTLRFCPETIAIRLLIEISNFYNNVVMVSAGIHCTSLCWSPNNFKRLLFEIWFSYQNGKMCQLIYYVLNI